MNPYYFKRIDTASVPSAWQLIELLKAEGADITFTALESEADVLSWVDNPEHLVYAAIKNNDSESSNSERASFETVCALVRGRRENTPEKKHAAYMTAATHPEHRGKGLAAQLTEFALEAMTHEGVNIARIYVYSDNKASLQAVSKLGFQYAGAVLRHHQCPQTGLYVDDMIYHKILD